MQFSLLSVFVCVCICVFNGNQDLEGESVKLVRDKEKSTQTLATTKVIDFEFRQELISQQEKPDVRGSLCISHTQLFFQPYSSHRLNFKRLLYY